MIPRPLLTLFLVGCADPERADVTEADTGAAARLSPGAAWQYATNANPATVGAADLNGDGRVDLVLGREGAPGGAVLVFLAKATGPRFAAAPDLQFNVNETSIGWGEEQLVLGDFNCDGKIDAAVGVNGASTGESYEGQVFVYAGNGDGTFADRSATPAPTWLLQPNVVNERVGTHLAVYDANHDGCSDLLVPGATRLRGALGSAAGPSFTTTWTLSGSQNDAGPIGDVNGDGNEDFAWWDSAYGGSAGQVAVFLGTGTGFPAALHRTIVGTPGANLGGYTNHSGVTGGDLDGDGFDELIVGAPGGNGRVDVYRGGVAGIGASPTWSLPGPLDAYSGWYGMSVVSGFDENGDGYDDLLIGEPSRDWGTMGYHGRWWLVVGSPAGPVAANPAQWSSNREEKQGAYGRHAWSFGDLDADGYDDVVLEDVGVTKLGVTDAETQLLTGGPDVDTDGDGYLDPADCAPFNPLIHPGVAELYGNLVDEDCNGTDDCLADDDQDGYGSKVVVANLSGGCSAIDRESAIGGDCDDTNAKTHPGGNEQAADGVDGDCDGSELCYMDSDGDTFGVSFTLASPDLSCAHPGLAAVAGDCDDKRLTVFPGAPEVVADGVDQDCDGAEACAQDKDADGHGSLTALYITTDLTCQTYGASRLRDDCNDTNASVHPGAGEQPGDGLDGDCDGLEWCWADGDGDGQGTYDGKTITPDLTCTSPGHSALAGDCNDKSAAIHTGAVEQPMDGVDQDCDGTELCPSDKDGDLHADPILYTPWGNLECISKQGVPPRDDCDDSRADIHPGAYETIADGHDDDCDGWELCFRDADGDAYGNNTGISVASKNFACDSPGMAQSSKDCNDGNALAHPGSPEVPADGVDENCDGLEDCYVDNDGDDWGSSSVQGSKSATCAGSSDATRSGDCDDKQSKINPDAVDVPHDGIDQNCDGTDLCLRDTDGDGYGGTNTLDNGDADCTDPGETSVGGDCDDLTIDAHPGAPDATNDGVDSDCDGLDMCYVDRDGDGAGGAATAPGPMGCKGAGVAPLQDDCDDLLTTVHPGGIDVPGDAVDQDCNGKLTCFVDADGDGSGGTGVGETTSCSNPGWSLLADDCNDKRADIHPGAPEVGGDGIDQDCTGADGCYVDLDGDAYGSKEVAANGKSCAGLAVLGGDCDDANAAINPGKVEVIGDPRDNDCDGAASCYVDGDSDQWGGAVLVLAGGASGSPVDCGLLGRAYVGGDCNDESGQFHPEASDRDGWDYDCDGEATCFEDLDLDHYGGVIVAFDVAPGTAADCSVDGLAPVDGDCDDEDPTANPDRTEVVGDAIDQDCDGLRACYVDSDGDGVGTSTPVGTNAADCLGSLVAAVQGDCQDSNAAVSPNAAEICDGLDNNCNGRPDEGYPWVDLADPAGTCDNTHVAFCGCASGGTPASGALGVLLALVLRRRRAYAVRPTPPDRGEPSPVACP